MVQGPTVFSCPRCGADLYTRRPMSYAEMEGFEDCGDDGLRCSGVAVVRRGVLSRLLRGLRRLVAG